MEMKKDWSTDQVPTWIIHKPRKAFSLASRSRTVQTPGAVFKRYQQQKRQNYANDQYDDDGDLVEPNLVFHKGVRIHRETISAMPKYKKSVQTEAKKAVGRAKETLSTMPGSEMWEMAKAKRRFKARAKGTRQ
jgi:hypothetical protein